MNEINKRDAYFDNLRYFLMFVVVFCHGIENFRSSSLIIEEIHNNLLLFVMPLFVFVSGFFAKSMGDAENPKRSKIINLFVLYILVQVVKCIISGSFTLIKPTYGNWYLICLVVWYTTLPFIKGFKPFYVIVTTVLFGLLIGAETSGMTIFQVSRMVCFFPFFVLGYYTKKEYLNVFKGKYIIGIIGLILSVVALHVLTSNGFSHSILHANKCYSEMKYSVQLGVFYRLIWYFLSTFTSCCVLCLITSKQNMFTNIGKYTLPIYILHTCLYLFLIKRTSLLDYISENTGTAALLIGNFDISFIILIIFGNAFFSGMFDKLMKCDFRVFK